MSTPQGPFTVRKWQNGLPGAVVLENGKQILSTTTDTQTKELTADLTATIGAPPSPPPPPSPGPTGVLWQPKFIVGENPDDADFAYTSFVPGHVTVISDPTYGAILNFAIPDSDRPYAGATAPRADLESPAILEEGATYYFSVTVRIPQAIAPAGVAPNYPWFLVAEMYGKPYDGSPYVDLGLTAFDESPAVNHWCMSMGSSPTKVWIGPTVDTDWHEFVYKVTLATMADGGGFAIWMDGAPEMLWTSMSTWGTANDGAANFLNLQQYRMAGSWPGTVVTQHAAPWIATGWTP